MFSNAKEKGDPRRFSRDRPKTIRQTNDLTLFHFFLLLFSLRNFFVILLMSSEAEAGSAEEHPAKE
jgi:hypothetical protein